MDEIGACWVATAPGYKATIKLVAVDYGSVFGQVYSQWVYSYTKGRVSRSGWKGSFKEARKACDPPPGVVFRRVK